jgi:glycosyltransferase involved in cell wall biosynthesis
MFGTNLVARHVDVLYHGKLWEVVRQILHVRRTIRTGRHCAFLAIGEYSGIVCRLAISLTRQSLHLESRLYVREAQPTQLETVLATRRRGLSKWLLIQVVRFGYRLGWTSISSTQQRADELANFRRSPLSLYTHIRNPLAVSPPEIDVVRRRTQRISSSQSGGPVRLVFAGVLNDLKNIDQLLEAVCLLPSNFSLTLVGDGRSRVALQRKAELLDLTRVEFVGSVLNVRPILDQCDLFVSASLVESYGNAIAEAVVAGLPVVSTPSGPGVHMFRRDFTYFRVSAAFDGPSLALEIMDLCRSEIQHEVLFRDGAKAFGQHNVEAIAARYLALLACQHSHDSGCRFRGV